MQTGVAACNNRSHLERGELKGILTLRNRIKGEKFKRGDSIRALLRYVSVDPQYGLFLELTRTSPKFLESLMENEVPEIADGVVEITGAARIPGERAKIALKTEQMNVDPIGAAVGVKGVRINAVSEELNGENIDCIEFSPIPEIFITRALSPAITQSIKVDADEKKAIINITGDQKAKVLQVVGQGDLGDRRLDQDLAARDVQLAYRALYHAVFGRRCHHQQCIVVFVGDDLRRAADRLQQGWGPPVRR